MRCVRCGKRVKRYALKATSLATGVTHGYGPKCAVAVGLTLPKRTRAAAAIRQPTEADPAQIELEFET
jgi:hypothetical protein